MRGGLSGGSGVSPRVAGDAAAAGGAADKAPVFVRLVRELLFGNNSIAAGDGEGRSGVPGDGDGDDGSDAGDTEGDMRSDELSNCIPGAVGLPEPAPGVSPAVAGLLPAVAALAPGPLPAVALGGFGLLLLLEAPPPGLLVAVVPLADEPEPVEPTKHVKS